jgi:hypothetical protein
MSFRVTNLSAERRSAVRDAALERELAALKSRRFGVAGLFVFVFMPFWMTGPVVGAVIGYLLGLPTRTTLAVVLAGTYAAVAVYALFLDQVDAWTSAYGPYAAFLALVALVALAMLLQRWRRQARPPR